MDGSTNATQPENKLYTYSGTVSLAEGVNSGVLTHSVTKSGNYLITASMEVSGTGSNGDCVLSLSTGTNEGWIQSGKTLAWTRICASRMVHANASSTIYFNIHSTTVLSGISVMMQVAYLGGN